MRKLNLGEALVLIPLLVISVRGMSQSLSVSDQRRCEDEAKAVTIIRDQWGIPHIYGKTDADVVFGLMYTECCEDFSRVEKNYLEMLGRQSEAYGDAYLYNDVMMRLIYDSTQAIADYGKSPAWMRKLLDAFADGVNYYLYKHPETKPVALTHFQPWYALMFTDGSVSATSTGGLRIDEIKDFYSRNPGYIAKKEPRKRPQVSDVELMILEDRGIKPGGSDEDAVAHSGAASGGSSSTGLPLGGAAGGAATGGGSTAGGSATGLALGGAAGGASRGGQKSGVTAAGQRLGGDAGGPWFDGERELEPDLDDVPAPPVIPGDAPAGNCSAPLIPGIGDNDCETGSNGFALAGFRTASESPELYINPHVPFYFRLEVHLVSEEGLNTYGAVTWGQFFIYQGFNAHCGWMHTSSTADVADVYEEKVRQDGNKWVYEYEGHTKNVTTRPLTISYRSGSFPPGLATAPASNELQSLSVVGLYTHHGPVLAGRDGKWLSLKEYNRSLNALLEAWLITKANTFDEYKKAMDIRANTTNNTVYADDQGNIAYWHGNFLPRRDTTYNWSLPVDGSIAATEWKGIHELDEMVHVYNPATGWIQNCNSTPYTCSGNSSPQRARYAAYMAPDGENFRALNAVHLLSGASEFTLDSLITKGYDRYLGAFDVLLPPLFEAYASASDSVKRVLQEPISILQKWDRRAATHSVATTLAVEWGTRMAQYAPKPHLPEDYTNAVVNITAEINNATPAQRTTQLLNTIAYLKERYGNWKVEWGEINRYQRLTGKITESYDDDKFSRPAGLASSAFGSLPSYASKVMPDTKKRYGYSGNSFIAAIEFGKKIKAKTIVTGGESSRPGSPHFTDQSTLYLGGWFKDVNFYKEDVLQNADVKYHPGEEPADNQKN